MKHNSTPLNNNRSFQHETKPISRQKKHNTFSSFVSEIIKFAVKKHSTKTFEQIMFFKSTNFPLKQVTNTTNDASFFAFKNQKDDS